jgi:hypothetical protein
VDGWRTDGRRTDGRRTTVEPFLMPEQTLRYPKPKKRRRFIFPQH